MFLGLYETQVGGNFVIEIIYLNIYFCTCFLFLHFKPNLSESVVSFSVLVVMVTTARVSTGDKAYNITEYMISSLAFVFLLMILVPSNWKVNMM